MSSTLKIAIGATLLVTLGATLVVRGSDPKDRAAATRSAGLPPLAEPGDNYSKGDESPLPASTPQERARHAFGPEPGTDAGEGAEVPPPPPDPYLPRLDRLAASFLTEDPDLVEFNELVRSLGREARVLPETVTTVDEELVKGELAFDKTSLRAGFEIEGDRFRVELGSQGTKGLRPPPLTVTPPFAQALVTFVFRDDGGIPDRPGFAVQYHPDTSKSARTSGLEDGETKLSGYSVSVSPTGARANPILVRASGRTWEIGRLDGATAKPVEGPPYDTSAFGPWLGLLRPFAR